MDICTKLETYFNIYSCHKFVIDNDIVSYSDHINIRLNPRSSVNQLPVYFGKLPNGLFEIQNNELTTLAGSPSIVGRDFNCSGNKLKSLKGGPTHVGGNYYCEYNSLTSLEGAPSVCYGNFDCSFNRLKDLKFAPSVVSGDFDCTKNPDLISLKGIPKYIGGGLYVTYQQNLGLLSLLTSRFDRLSMLTQNRTLPPSALIKILQKYQNRGTRVILSCAMEMIKAGFGGNARM